MSRIVRFLGTQLWREDARARRARRIRQALLAPVTALAGIIWGALAAPAAAEALGWALGGAMGFSLLGYLYFRLEPVVQHVGAALFGERGWLTGVVWDWAVVGGFVFLLTDVLGMPTFNAVTSAILIGGSYAMGVAWFFDDGGSRALSGFLAGSWGRTRVAFSHIEVKIVRGEHEAAIHALEEFVEHHPRDPRGWLSLARQLDQHRDDPNGALRVLREGLDLARLTVEQRHRYLVEFVRICESCDATGKAVPELRRFVDRFDGTLQADWARIQLRQIRAASEGAGATGTG